MQFLVQLGSIVLFLFEGGLVALIFSIIGITGTVIGAMKHWKLKNVEGHTKSMKWAIRFLMTNFVIMAGGAPAIASALLTLTMPTFYDPQLIVASIMTNIFGVLYGVAGVVCEKVYERDQKAKSFKVE